MLRGRAGRNNGLNSRGEREKEREGGVEERRERWEVRGGEWKGAGTCTVLLPVCVCHFVFSWVFTVHHCDHLLLRVNTSTESASQYRLLMM